MSKRKIVFVGVALAVLVFCLYGLNSSMRSPLEVSSKQSVSLLSYRHSGQFDYQATIQPAIYYGSPAAQESADSKDPLLVPYQFIKEFKVSYSFQPGAVSDWQVELNADLESQGTWKKTVNLAPRQKPDAGSGLEILLDLNRFLDLGDAIGKEIDANSGGYGLTLIANISDASGLIFSQPLPLKISKSFVTIPSELTASNGEMRGRFGYKVSLTDNLLFGAVTLTPPPPPSEPQLINLNSSETIFTRLVNTLNFTYSYKLTADHPVSSLEEEVQIEAVLTNPDKWTRTMVLVPAVKKSGGISIPFSIKPEHITELFDSIQKETGVSVSEYLLSINAIAHVSGKTGSGAIDEVFTHSISTNLRDGILKWDGDLKKSQDGSITDSRTITAAGKLWGLPVLWLRIILFVLVAAEIVLLVFLFLPYLRKLSGLKLSGLKLSPAAAAVKANSKYKAMIAEVVEAPPDRPFQDVINVKSMDDLVRVAQALLKPINYKNGPEKHIWWVTDGTVRYQYFVVSPPETTPDDPL